MILTGYLSFIISEFYGSWTDGAELYAKKQAGSLLAGAAGLPVLIMICAWKLLLSQTHRIIVLYFA